MGAFDRVRKVEALIITHRDFGEADRLLQAITPEIGKIAILARGVRKAGSRKAAHIEPFTHSSLILARGKSFWILTQAETIENFQQTRLNLHKTGLAAYLLELTDHMTFEEQADHLIFRTVLDALREIDRSDDPFLPACYYEIRLLDQTGFKPDLFHCVNCGKEIVQEDQFFSIPQGGVICPDCSRLQQNLAPASQETLKYLRHLQRSSFKAVKRLDIPHAIRIEIRKILDPFVSSITERKMNSPDFIQQINQLGKDL